MKSSVITRDSGILCGVPVFECTRVPIRNFFDCLESGYTIDQFLNDFPTVRREQVIALLEETKSGMPGDRLRVLDNETADALEAAIKTARKKGKRGTLDELRNPWDSRRR